MTAGITRALADDRAKRVSDVRYELHCTVPPERTTAVAARVVVRFHLSDAGAPLALDFAPGRPAELLHGRVNDLAVDLLAADGHLELPASALRPGLNEIELPFAAGDAPLNRRDDLLYTLFVPARAHEAFPCFDQPNLRARWTLTLILPADWTAVSNAPQLHSTASTDSSTGGTSIAFAETEPLPTYLFAFAAGRFSVQHGERAGRPIDLYHCAADAALVAAQQEVILDLHAHALDWLEHYTAVPYPFPKFDIVVLPAFQFSGMEHPGAIYYGSASLLLPAQATRQQLLSRASLIAHETAHIWFGDLVTIAWFDDVWVKEVFANFMAAKIVNPAFPEVHHDLRFLHAHYPGAYDVDRTAGAHPIRQPLDNLTDAGLLYGAIVYLKAPIVMRQIELRLGERALRDALRELLARFRFGCVSWPDLIALLAARAPIDIARWSRDWIDEPGRPIVTVERAQTDTGGMTIILCSTDPVAGRGLAWPQPLAVDIGYEDAVEQADVWLDREIDLPVHARDGRAPNYILPNGRGLGYGEFRLDRRSLEWLLVHLPAIADPLRRGSAWLTLWDAMLAGSVTPDALVELACETLPTESDELNLQRVFSCTERLLWIFLEPAQRLRAAAGVERVMRRIVESTRIATVRSAALHAFGAIALTDASVAWLFDLWSGSPSLPALEVDEAQRVQLACELAVRRGDGDEIVRRQIGSTMHADRQAALAFIAPALSNDRRERERFFGLLCDPSNRRREPWVVDGLKWLHHPLRATLSLPLIRPGLDLLEEIQRTGDIFLPKRWLDAILGGHRSAAAAAIVDTFLDDRPQGYPPALERMVRASADHLRRVRRV